MLHTEHRKRLVLIGVAGVIIVGVGLMSRVGIRFPWAWLLPFIFSGIILAITWVARPRRVGRTEWILPWVGFFLIVVGVVITIIYALTAATLAAWGMTVFVFTVFIILDLIFNASFENLRPASPISELGRVTEKGRIILTHLLGHFVFALACGVVVAVLAQIDLIFPMRNSLSPCRY